MNCPNITYTLRSVLRGWLVGHAHSTPEAAEKEAQELAAVNSQPVAIIEEWVWLGGRTEGVFSIVGETGKIAQIA